MISPGERRRRLFSGGRDQLGRVLGRGLGGGMEVGTVEGKQFVVLCQMLAQP
jgi:hypothetical protein